MPVNFVSIKTLKLSNVGAKLSKVLKDLIDLAKYLL